MSKRKLFLFCAVVMVAMAVAVGPALADHDPDSSSKVDPHAGYSTLTDRCLQCHDMHEAAGDYALMRYSTVTFTCRTCHGVYTVGPTGAYDPGYDPDGGSIGEEATVAIPMVGFGSQQRVYETTEPASHEGHRIGQKLNGAGPYTYADGVSTDSAAYIPGGSSKLTRIPSWSYWKGAMVDGTLPPIDASLWDAANEATAAGGGTTALGGLYCGSCHALHGDKGDTGWGNSLPESVYHDASETVTYYPGGFDRDIGPMNNKLLTAMPNHTSPSLVGVVTTWTVNGYEYCARCHDKRLERMVLQGTDTSGNPWYTVDGTGTHNHPGYVCLSCHANDKAADGSDAANWDFPHTGNKNLLFSLPDEICITCHPKGTLP